MRKNQGEVSEGEKRYIKNLHVVQIDVFTLAYQRKFYVIFFNQSIYWFNFYCTCHRKDHKHSSYASSSTIASATPHDESSWTHTVIL